MAGHSPGRRALETVVKWYEKKKCWKTKRRRFVHKKYWGNGSFRIRKKQLWKHKLCASSHVISIRVPKMYFYYRKIWLNTQTLTQFPSVKSLMPGFWQETYLELRTCLVMHQVFVSSVPSQGSPLSLCPHSLPWRQHLLCCPVFFLLTCSWRSVVFTTHQHQSVSVPLVSMPAAEGWCCAGLPPIACSQATQRCSDVGEWLFWRSCLFTPSLLTISIADFPDHSHTCSSGVTSHLPRSHFCNIYPCMPCLHSVPPSPIHQKPRAYLSRKPLESTALLS